MLEAYLKAIHATPHMLVMNFAGAGAESLAWLHSVGGSSRTILEATDRYTQTSLIEATGFKPESYTSVRVAKALAKHAQQRARQLSDPKKPIFGIGCTASIATDRKKRGDHRVAIAVADALGVTSYELIMQKGARSRAEEENLVSWLIIYAITEASGLFNLPKLELLESELVKSDFEPAEELRDLMAGKLKYVVVEPQGKLSQVLADDLAILSGSFNPLHDGHRSLAEVAATQLNEDAYFELSLTNVDKAPIDLGVARKRAVQFLGLDHLILSRAPLFSDKAASFPGVTFVIGADTATRLIDLKYYNHNNQELDESFDYLRSQDASFLVAGRSRHGVFLTLDDIAIPTKHHDLFKEVPKEEFQMDISSSAIRKTYKAD